jgi:hypothetical protein
MVEINIRVEGRRFRKEKGGHAHLHVGIKVFPGGQEIAAVQRVV